MDYNYIHNALLDLNVEIKETKNLNSTQAKEFFMYDQYRQNIDKEIDISSSLSQNVLYRIAKELHGYA